jgi:hypothetical protein
MIRPCKYYVWCRDEIYLVRNNPILAQSGEGLADAEQHCDGGAAIALGQSFPRGCLFRPSCALRKGLPEMRGNLAGAEGTYQVVAVG